MTRTYFRKCSVAIKKSLCQYFFFFFLPDSGDDNVRITTWSHAKTPIWLSSLFLDDDWHYPVLNGAFWPSYFLECDG